MNSSKILEFNIGRIANHSVKSTPCENLWETLFPIECVDTIFFVNIICQQRWLTEKKIVVDEAIALADMSVKRRQRLISSRSVKPQRKLCDLDRGRIDIYAID